MDAVSFSKAAQQAARIGKIINEPDATSGLVTLPSTIAVGETITIPAGRTVVHPKLQVDGTLVIDGTLFIPSGGTYTADEVDVTVVKQNGELVATETFVSTAISSIPDVVDATSSVKGIDYKGLLYEAVVTGSAVTSIDFSGLDINTHKSYRVEIELNNTVSTGLYCFVNNDTVLTNYWSQSWGGNHATYTGNRANNATVATLSTVAGHTCTLNCSKANGTPLFTGISSSQLSATIVGYNVFMFKTTTVTNITQLTFTSSAASAIGVGSKIRIYRGDV